MKLKKFLGSSARGFLSRKTFGSVAKVAAVAAATYFTGGAALPLILKAAAAKRGLAMGGGGDYSELLNDAWDSSNLSNNIGLGGLVDQVRGLGDNPLIASLQQTGRGVMAMRGRRRSAPAEEEDTGDEEEEDYGDEDEEEEE